MELKKYSINHLNNMKINKQSLKFLTLFFLVILLLNFPIIAQQETKDIDYYLDENTEIEKFNELDRNSQSEIYQSGDETQKISLLDKKTQEIREKLQLSASGTFARFRGKIDKQGIKNANYPSEKISWKGLDNSNLKFYGENGNVIGNGKVNLPLDRLPKFVTEIQYSSQDNGIFILKGKDGEVIKLSTDSITKDGNMKFAFEQNGNRGHDQLSYNLNDYEFEGEIELYIDGFKLNNQDSKIVLGDITFERMDGVKGRAEVFFKNDRNSIFLLGSSLEKEGKYFISPQKTDSGFKVIFGADKITFPDGIAISDEGTDEKISLYVNPGNIGANIKLYDDVGILDVYDSGKAGIKLDINPSKEGGADIEILNGQINKLGHTIDIFEVGIDEIRLRNTQEIYDLNNIKSIKKGYAGNFNLVAGDRITVSSATFNPLADSLIINGEVILNELGLPKNLKGYEKDLGTATIKVSVPIKEALSFDTSSKNAIEKFPEEMKNSNFKVDLGINLPADPLKIFAMQTYISSYIDEILVKGALGKSIQIPANNLEITLYKDIKTPAKELKLKQTYVDNLNNGVAQIIKNLNLGSKSHLIFQNDPINNDMSVQLISGEKSYNIDLNQDTRQFIRNSLVLSFNAPALDSQGNVKTGFHDLFGPWNIKNAPIIPNNAFNDFCKSVGYLQGFCHRDSKNRFNDYFDNYYNEL